jgi:hypothetical protein
MGVPVALLKSAPLCGLRGCPFRIERVPNALFAGSGTGLTNGSVHSFVVDE